MIVATRAPTVLRMGFNDVRIAVTDSVVDSDDDDAVGAAVVAVVVDSGGCGGRETNADEVVECSEATGVSVDRDADDDVPTTSVAVAATDGDGANGADEAVDDCVYVTVYVTGADVVVDSWPSHPLASARQAGASPKQKRLLQIPPARSHAVL